MRLKLVFIRGFRSIEEMKISFDGNGHKILVGKNESGKSNILNALNLLSGSKKFEQADAKVMYDGTQYVNFWFELDNHEIDKCRTKFIEKFPAGQDAELTKALTVKSFFEEHSKYIVYRVECDKNGYWTYSAFDKSLEIDGIWHSVSPKVVDYGLHKKIPAGSYITEGWIKILLNEQEQEAIRNCLETARLEDIYNFLRQQVREIAVPKNFTFPIRYWRYAAREHDLPDRIEREVFSQQPDSCIPLKNMFLLAGIQEKDIHDRISKAHNRGRNHLKSLLDHVNTKANEYIKKSWKEYNNVEIELKADGENIIGIGIQDTKNIFDFKDRSDGFRRLVSFLLLISTEIDTRQHPHSPLILIDEPETGLHPSSAKDLKYKLIELGQEALIIYATHSISMIDTDNVENNLIVSKDKENTTYEEAKEDGISPAEIVYQAIGYSIFEELKKKNILLEGYTDKQPLELFVKKWKDIGICYTGGAKNIRCVTSMLDLASREYFVLSDGDDAAKRKKKDMEHPDYWYTYEDLGSKAITVEDFYQKTFFVGIVKKMLTKYKIEVEPSVLSDKILSEDNDRMEAIKGFLFKEHKDFLREQAITNNRKDADGMVKQITDDIKRECAASVTKAKVMQEKITEMLNALMEKINDSQNSG